MSRGLAIARATTKGKAPIQTNHRRAFKAFRFVGEEIFDIIAKHGESFGLLCTAFAEPVFPQLKTRKPRPLFRGAGFILCCLRDYVLGRQPCLYFIVAIPDAPTHSVIGRPGVALTPILYGSHRSANQLRYFSFATPHDFTHLNTFRNVR